jgi:lysophospholipase L1-like esterase
MKSEIKRSFAILLAIGAALSLGLVSALAQITVTCVGDSITAGYGLTNAGTQSYPAQLQTLLGGGYTVINDGASGSTVLKVSDNSFWSSSYSSWAYTNSMNSSPNIVVMMFGANDSKTWNWNAANFNSDYRALITQYQNLPTHPKVFIGYTPPMFLPTAFGTTFDPVFIENTVEPAIATIATQAGGQLIDNDTPLLNRPDLFQDGVHPTVPGAAIVAQQVYNAIKGLAPTNLTTAAITSSGTPSVYGSPVTYTATLTSSAGTVTGAVVFAANNVPFSTNTLSSGTASVTNSLVPIGANVVAAQYVSQGKYLGNTHSLYQNVTTGIPQTLTDIGSAAPSPGTNDISQLSTGGNTTWPDGINYFTDNNPPVGQTFTTGTNAMKLVSVAIKTAGLNSGIGYGTPASTPTYYLRIYSMSNSTATLLVTISAPNPGFTDGDWLKWSGLNVSLATNKAYAFSFGIKPGSGGWAALAVATGAYAGGEIALIPTSGGTITTGDSHSFDAVFDLGLQAAATNISATMPWPNPTYGMNVGNELELNWGPPNMALFYSAVQNGFNAVRIPCAWDMSGATTNISGGVINYVINPAYMAQVKQTVDAAIAAGMYVMINDHWDDGWLQSNIGTTVDPVINAKVNAYWTQIATTFAGYDNHLLFAASNEPDVTSPAAMDTLMYYYQTFVNAVRSVGGNNTNRWLVLQGGGDTSWLNSLPTDTVTNRLMVEYHCYSPFQFTQLQGDASWGAMQYFWGPAYHYSGDPSHDCGTPEEGGIDAGFQQLVDQYVSKGIPVMIGEFQAAGKSVLSTNATEQAWNSLSCYYWNKYVVDSAHAHGMSPFYWSTGGSPLDYGTGAVNDTNAVRVLTGGVAFPPPNGAPYAASGLSATRSNNTNVYLSWTAGSGATSYNLYRAAESGGEPTNPVVTGITGTTYTDTNLNSGTTYYYQVVAVNGSGPAGYSPEACATTTGVNQDSAQFNFETDSQGWYTDGNPLIAGLATSTTQHFAGRQSLAVNISTNTAGSSQVRVDNMSVLPGQTITFHVWIPSGSKISTLQPFIQDNNWTFTSGWYGSFAAGWNTLTYTVPANAVSPFHYLGITFSTSAGWTNTCYIDSVSWNAPAPDFSVSANPTSLTVKGGTNGTSAITVTALNGLNACYTLSATNLPGGVTATFATNPIAGGANTLTLTASNAVTSGTSNVTIIATAGLISHTQTIALTLTGPTNTPPVLAAIANQTVNVAQTVAFTASATDTDQPPQTLTFSLLAGPGTATLNAGSGAFSWTPQPSDAGTTNLFTLKVADNGSPSLSATQSFSVRVNKQTPVLTAPVATTITYGQTLASSSLSSGAATNLVNNASVAGGFAFTTPATAPGAGTASQSVTFTPTDTAHYNPATVSVNVTVNKQTPGLKAPVATAITYGQTLTNSSLSGGAATNSANNASVAGGFAFTTPTMAPGAGTANQSVTFTPTDTSDYNLAAVNVSVTVNLASPTLAFSSSKNPSGYNEGVIFTASLPTNAVGNVNFLTNGVLFDARTLSGGSAMTTNSTLPNGTNLITAIYSGDSNYLGRTNVLNQVVTNPPPVLAAISNQTVNVGQPVAFTASATDTDQPPQTLTFALLAGATNATLNTNSGAFSFRPLVTQADTTNNFTLQVSDKGTPSLSATQSFSVAVNPLSAPGMSSISFAGGQPTFIVSGQSGPDYAIEASTNLAQWSSVFITNSPVLPFTWTDTVTNSPQRFYRIKLGPPLP